jgi:uncharacterized protein (DUF1697 family)
MIKYVAFLRGINVGGHHIVKMENLRELFAAMNFENVGTYIQSGNVIFEAPEKDSEILGEKIERELQKAFGFEIKVMPRAFAELEEIVRQNPFRETAADATVYISFLSAAPDEKLRDSLLDLETDFEVFRFKNREMYYLRRPDNPAKELFSNNFIEKRLRVAATTRNITTLDKILLLK